MKLPITLVALGVAALAGVGLAQAQPPHTTTLGLRSHVSAGPILPHADQVVKPGPRAKRLEKKGTPAQKAWANSFLGERAHLHAGVTAHTLTKKSAHQQLRAWLKANRPPHK